LRKYVVLKMFVIPVSLPNSVAKGSLFDVFVRTPWISSIAAIVLKLI